MPSKQPSLVRDLIALTKPSLSTLVVITAAGGWFLAPQSGEWAVGLFAVLGTTITVGAANTFNQYLEQDSDQLMARTKDPTACKTAPQSELGFVVWHYSNPYRHPHDCTLANPLCGHFRRYRIDLLCADLHPNEKNILLQHHHRRNPWRNAPTDWLDSRNKCD